jgi:hypothetical protein
LSKNVERKKERERKREREREKERERERERESELIESKFGQTDRFVHIMAAIRKREK